MLLSVNPEQTPSFLRQTQDGSPKEREQSRIINLGIVEWVDLQRLEW
jgi:hypothetical protein